MPCMDLAKIGTHFSSKAMDVFLWKFKRWQALSGGHSLNLRVPD